MKKLPLLAAALLALPAAADEPAIALSGATPGAWTQDYAAATNAAATDGKPVFLDFTGSDWCGWCMLMEEKVFSTQAWKDWATNLYLVTLDFPRDKSKVPEDFRKRNRELSKQYGVRGYPTYIVLDSKGEKLGQLGASRDATPAKFIRQLCRVLGVDPPAKAAAAPVDPAAKRIVDGIAATMKETEKKALAMTDDPTMAMAELGSLFETASAGLDKIDTAGAPEKLLAAFQSLRAAFAGMKTEIAKPDQEKKLKEFGKPPEKALETIHNAFEEFVAEAVACGVEDASDLLNF